ncbi:hypothetical protein GJU41_19495 [Bacillus idriensis]|uniref:Uncharacterized protein n=1 Tax=Metabacillus idriensis TaxID=324768 RepID=A0A6I2MGI3_9BACI|nr:hypothetical protein [Metabacillus idriensis]MRX56146.1 hypothetical protein [Metabacillus idriensis]
MNEYKSVSEQAKTRGLGGKRVCRVSVSMTSEYDRKLHKLSLACGGMSKSRLSDELLKIALDSPNVIEFLQKKHGGAFEEYWVSPTLIKEKGKQTVVY